MRLSLVFVTALTLAGCGLPHLSRAKAPPPPGPVPVRIPDQITTTDTPTPTNLPAPPTLSAPPADAKAPATAELAIPATPTTPPPRPARNRRTTKRAAVTPPPAPVEAAPEQAQPPAPPFRLGELRSPEEKERLKQQAEQMIGTCQTALAAAEGKPLTATQVEMVGRVRTFAQQAREAMEKDPGEARNFAAKGRTFAEALLAELK